MAKRKWFMLGALGALFGVVMKLVRGRRQEHLEAGRWEPTTPTTPTTPPSETKS